MAAFGVHISEFKFIKYIIQLCPCYFSFALLALMTFATKRQMVDLVFRLPKTAIFASETKNANSEIILSKCVLQFCVAGLNDFFN